VTFSAKTCASALASPVAAETWGAAPHPGALRATTWMHQCSAKPEGGCLASAQMNCHATWKEEGLHRLVIVHRVLSRPDGSVASRYCRRRSLRASRNPNSVLAVNRLQPPTPQITGSIPAAKPAQFPAAGAIRRVVPRQNRPFSVTIPLSLTITPNTDSTAS
jgi:hypothetical protein